MNRGFGSDIAKKNDINILKKKKEPKGRLISWSPWPPANFQTRYPAFPLVMTILILVLIQLILSLPN